ncbi:MAG: GNAT family N-acetyltransferase [Candidatus Promineifilaceae bacterium]|nr:GNAT family N-acetyltransferase [Candidatus Promineifilaceae bacterium]
MAGQSPAPIFTTVRLAIVVASPADANLYVRLWTDPRVMGNVGFPQGIPTTQEEVAARIRAEQDQPPFGRLLLVRRQADGQAIGECKLYRPDRDGISETDIKLLPRFWSQGYGTEIKRGLIDYLFAHTDCRAVQATPNVDNQASIRMQENVGGICVGLSIFRFPAQTAMPTQTVHSYIYRVFRPGVALDEDMLLS